jgi:hypothetical protein
VCFAVGGSCSPVSIACCNLTACSQVKQELRRRLSQQVSGIETTLRKSESETQALTAGKAAVTA